MSESYAQDFEDEPIQQQHQLRLSIQFHSIKQLLQPMNLYFKFNNKLLGTCKTPAVTVRKNTQTRVQNAFQAHQLSMTKSQLYPSLNQTPLLVQVWQADKYAKDSCVGKLEIILQQLLRAPLKKTPESVLRVLDRWVLVQQGTRKIGQVRVLLYLEDLGPKLAGAVLAQAQGATDYQAAWELQLWRRAEEAK